MARVATTMLWLITSLFLSSCAGTGGTIGGLFPAPKILKGKVESVLYYAPDNVFSVRLPYPPTRSKEDSYEWTYARVQEINDGPVIGVIFGPAAFDQNLYHAVLVRTPIKGNKENHVKYVFDKKIKSRPGTYAQKTMFSFNLNGRNCYYAVYENEKSYVLLSLTDATNSFFAVDVDVLKDNWSLARETDFVNRKWDTFNDMLESFTIMSTNK